MRNLSRVLFVVFMSSFAWTADSDQDNVNVVTEQLGALIEQFTTKFKSLKHDFECYKKYKDASLAQSQQDLSRERVAHLQTKAQMGQNLAAMQQALNQVQASYAHLANLLQGLNLNFIPYPGQPDNLYYAPVNGAMFFNPATEQQWFVHSAQE